MNIAYVCTDRGVPVFGSKGCSLHVQEVIRAFRTLGHAVTLYAVNTDGEAAADLQDLPVVRLQRQRAGNRALRERLDMQADVRDLRLFRQQLVPDLVYQRHSLFSSAGMRWAERLGVPGVLEINAPLIDEQARYRGLVDRDVAELAEARACAAASHLLAVSLPLADRLRQLPQTRGKLHVLPNGVNVERVQPLGAMRLEPGSPCTIGFVGTLKPWHGVDGLIRAFARLYAEAPQARLLIVGDGPEAAALKQQARTLGCDAAIEWTGALATEQMPQQLARMDIAVAPYPDEPGFYFSPLKIYEYLAAGLPVVASAMGQVPEIVEHRRNGLLYRPGDAQGLLQAQRCLLLEPSLARRLGANGRTQAVALHDWRSRVTQVLDWAGVGSRRHSRQVGQRGSG